MNFSRRDLLMGASSSAAIAAMTGGEAKARWLRGSSFIFNPIAKANLVVNLAQMTYYTSANGLLNWAQISQGLNDFDNTGQLASLRVSFQKGYRDLTTGELIPGAGLTNFISVGYGFFTVPVNYNISPTQGPGSNSGQTPWWKSQQWDISWTGTATASVSGTLGTGGTSSFGANSGTITFGTTDPNNVALVLTVTNVNDPPKNVKITLHEYTSLLGTTNWDPRYIAECAKWGVVRTVDTHAVNNGGPPSLNQFADFNYVILTGSYGGMSTFAATLDNGAGGAGNIFTVSAAPGSFNGSPLQVGTNIVWQNNTILGTVASLGTGTGGGGTYNLTLPGGNQLIASTSFAALIPPGSTTAFGGTGSKGGMHPSVYADLCVRANCHLWFCMPLGMTNAEVANIAAYFRDHAGMKAAGLQVWFETGNELWNNTEVSFWARTMTVPFGANQPMQWGYYRGSQMMQQVANTYGSTNRNRWRGIVGVQSSGNSTDTSAIAGINYYLTNEAPGGTKITDLWDVGATAPYIGPQSTSENAQPPATALGVPVSFVVSPGPSPTTITYPSNHGYTSGQVKRFFCAGGTGASLLNNLDLTVTVTSPTVITVAINSSGLTFTGNQFSCDPALFDIIDQSIALNGSPGYPTKYTYFVQQAAKAFITGSSDPQVNGTWTPGGGASIPSLLAQTKSRALAFNQVGLGLVNYEGGYNMGPAAPLNSLNQPGQVFDFIVNWVFDGTTPVDPTYNIATMYATAFGLQQQVWSQYPAKFSDNLPLAIDAWAGLRFFGDEGNGTFKAMLAQAALPPYIDPTPAYAATATYPTVGNSNYFFSNSGANPATDTLATAVIGTAAIDVFVLVSHTGGTVTGVTVDGVAATQVSGSGTSVSIWTAHVSAGTNVRSVSVVTSGGSFQNRSFYVITVAGLSSTTPLVAANAASNQINNLTVHKGELLLAIGRILGSPGSYATTTGVTQGTVTTLFSDINNTNAAVMAAFTSSFSTDLFTVAQGQSGSMAVATFR